jgi:hypothetical protein
MSRRHIEMGAEFLVFHQGQRDCRRCQKLPKICSGGGKAENCTEDKTSCQKVVKQVVEQRGYMKVWSHLLAEADNGKQNTTEKVATVKKVLGQIKSEPVIKLFGGSSRTQMADIEKGISARSDDLG